MIGNDYCAAALRNLLQITRYNGETNVQLAEEAGGEPSATPGFTGMEHVIVQLVRHDPTF
jgi:hypothetical protein